MARQHGRGPRDRSCRECPAAVDLDVAPTSTHSRVRIDQPRRALRLLVLALPLTVKVRALLFQ